MKSIVIAGYPKSGSTWITRLVAELVRCPVEGFWQSGHNEIAIEGYDRNSVFACFKSHHQLYELESLAERPWKTIYVIRDPRDIVFSGIPYFYRGYLKARKPRILSNSLLSRVYYYFVGKHEMKRNMIRTVLEGDASIHHWCRVSWAVHTAAYIADPSILKVTYRSMLENPQAECKAILKHLGLQRSDQEINSAIRKQSFDLVKRKFQNTDEVAKAKFMRKGKYGYWESRMSRSEKQLFADALGPRLSQLGFPV